MKNSPKSYWSNGIVPIAVKSVGDQSDTPHLLIADGDLLGIMLRVEHATNLQAGRRARVRDQVDDRGMGQQRPTPPALADEREQAMLDLIPLAGPRRQMTDMDGQARLAGEIVQPPLPTTHTGPVA